MRGGRTKTTGTVGASTIGMKHTSGCGCSDAGVTPMPSDVAIAISQSSMVGAVAPLGIATGGTRLLESRALMIGLAVAILSAAIPFTLEIHALRSIGPRTFGVAMSTSPAVAAGMGWVVLHEPLGLLQVVAIGFVGVASAGTFLANRT